MVLECDENFEFQNFETFKKGTKWGAKVGILQYSRMHLNNDGNKKKCRS